MTLLKKGKLYEVIFPSEVSFCSYDGWSDGKYRYISLFPCSLVLSLGILKDPDGHVVQGLLEGNRRLAFYVESEITDELARYFREVGE